MAGGTQRLVQCPTCKAKHDAAKFRAGVAATCPGCRAQFMVPASKDGGSAPTVKMQARPASPADDTAIGRKSTVKSPAFNPKKTATAAAAVPVAARAVPMRRERMTPLMRTVQGSNLGNPQNEPRASGMGGRRSKDNTPLIIAGVAGGVLMLIALVVVLNQRKKTPETTRSSGTANYGASTATSTDATTSSTAEPVASSQSPASSSGGATSRDPDSKPPDPASDGSGGSAPPDGDGGGIAEGDGEPPEEARPDPKWEIDPEVKVKVDGYIQELYDEVRASKDIHKDIRALGRAALPPIIETLNDPDTIKAIKASGLLSMLVDRNPISDPSATQELRRKFYEQEKTWYLRHYYDIEVASGERSKKSKEDIEAEIRSIVREIKEGGFNDRDRCVNLLKKYGKDVVPFLIGFLDDRDKDFAEAAATALTDLTKAPDMGPFPRSGSTDEFARKWRKWWEENKGKVSIP